MISGYKAAINLSAKHQVVVLTTGSPRYERLSSTLEVYRLWDLFLPDPLNFSIVPGIFYQTARLMKQLNPDIVLVNKYMFFTSLAIPVARLFKQPVVTMTDTFPGYNWFPRHKIIGLIMTLYHYLIGRLLLNMSDRVVLLHEGLIDGAKTFKLKYVVIHNGVDFEMFQNAKPAPDFDLKKNINIGYVGRLESIKGYNDYLAVARKLLLTNPKLKFYFIGNIAPSQQPFVKENQSQQVIFTGLRRDIPRVMKALDIFVLPSYSEGLPNALMEAMAANCACVASDVGGVKVLIQDGFNGLLFEPGDQEKLQYCLEQLIDNQPLREQLGKNAQQTIKKDFNWININSQYTKLFQELLNEGKNLESP
jgi:glycosyltransferase involved in cell wall biosynthesis